MEGLKAIIILMRKGHLYPYCSIEPLDTQVNCEEHKSQRTSLRPKKILGKQHIYILHVIFAFGLLKCYSNFCYATRQAEIKNMMLNADVKLLAKSCSWTTVVGSQLLHRDWLYIIDWNVLMPLCQSLYKSIKGHRYIATCKLELYGHVVTLQ